MTPDARIEIALACIRSLVEASSVAPVPRKSYWWEDRDEEKNIDVSAIQATMQHQPDKQHTHD